jgi:hypothetical protein
MRCAFRATSTWINGHAYHSGQDNKADEGTLTMRCAPPDFGGGGTSRDLSFHILKSTLKKQVHDEFPDSQLH